MGNEIRYKRIRDLSQTEVEGDLVLMDPVQGKYFSTNKVGNDIWNAMENGISHEQLVDTLSNRYNISAQDCAKQIEPFLKQLIDAELIAQE